MQYKCNDICNSSQTLILLDVGPNNGNVLRQNAEQLELCGSESPHLVWFCILWRLNGSPFHWCNEGCCRTVKQRLPSLPPQSHDCKAKTRLSEPSNSTSFFKVEIRVLVAINCSCRNSKARFWSHLHSLLSLHAVAMIYISILMGIGELHSLALWRLCVELLKTAWPWQTR